MYLLAAELRPDCVGELKLKTKSVQFVNILLKRFFFEQSNLVLFWIAILNWFFIWTNCLFEPILFLNNLFFVRVLFLTNHSSKMVLFHQIFLFLTRWSFWPTNYLFKTDSFFKNCYFVLILFEKIFLNWFFFDSIKMMRIRS